MVGLFNILTVTKMNVSIQRQPLWLANGTRLVSRQLFLTLSMIVLWGLIPAKAAYLTSEIPFGLSFPGGTFDSGETVTIIIWAGNASTPLDSVAGFDLSFTLTENAVFPGSLTPDLKYSWIADGEEMESQTELNSQELSINFYVIDSSFSQSGYGEIARFSILCGRDGQLASDLIASSGGGNVIIQVDDLILRKGAQTELSGPQSLEVYPNPCSGILHAYGPSDQIKYWSLRDLHGRLISEGSHFPINLNAIQIPYGMYSLGIWNRNGVRNTRLLLFRP